MLGVVVVLGLCVGVVLCVGAVLCVGVVLCLLWCVGLCGVCWVVGCVVFFFFLVCCCVFCFWSMSFPAAVWLSLP